MNIYRNLLIILGLSIALTFPYSAFAHKHIPFYITYIEGNEQLQLQCGGPWLRDTGLIEVSPGADHVKFYSAEVNFLSPYGKWSCSICVPGEGGATSCMGPILAKTDFHLKKNDDEVNLTMTKDSLHSDLEDSDTITATASLGDDNKRPRRDRDTFTFNFGPNPSDGAVRVTLEENPETGHIGVEATLILRSGNSNIELNSGMLPLEITAVLDTDKEYELVVQQHGIAEDLRFRGNYFLSVESEAGQIEEIRPTFDVEQ